MFKFEQRLKYSKLSGDRSPCFYPLGGAGRLRNGDGSCMQLNLWTLGSWLPTVTLRQSLVGGVQTAGGTVTCIYKQWTTRHGGIMP